ncbi:MAG: hypothetical protein HXX09_01230 [Bacteroidetes bacterium]|nr:hypothetical protein [Bacteroidota bacterium]
MKNFKKELVINKFITGHFQEKKQKIEIIVPHMETHMNFYKQNSYKESIVDIKYIENSQNKIIAFL